MMHIKIANGVVATYSIAQLLSENPNVSFPHPIPDHVLADYGVYEVKETDCPEFDQLTQYVTQGSPVFAEGAWQQSWTVSQLSLEDIAARDLQIQENIKFMRLQAYQREADPLFFKAQRGEATQQEWLDKVEEIKARYPD